MPWWGKVSSVRRKAWCAVPGTDLLIVSDYRYGLAALDIAKGKVTRLGSAKGGLFDGIDALQLHGHSLIAVQNGTRPMRILQLGMSDDWLAIESVKVLESNHPGWTEPVGGTVSGNEFIYVATGQWERFGEGGELAEGELSGPTEIRAIKLGK